MAKTLRTSGDYTVKTGAGYNGGAGSNTIDLDSRYVRIRGDLTVDGDQIVQNVTNTTVEDQFLEVNRNYSGAGAEDSGIVFNQGTQDDAIFYYDGTANEFRIGTTSRPIADGSTTKWEIDGGSFVLGNIKVATTPSDNNHAASKSYVDSQVSGGGFSIGFTGDDSTTVAVASGNTVDIAGGSNISTSAAEPDTVTVNLNNDLTNITSITSDASNGDLTLVANGTGDIVINNILTFSGTESTPAIDSSIPKLYHKTAAGGGTGVFFVNSDVSATEEGELISKKKATALAIALG
jgi:hypothetical protein